MVWGNPKIGVTTAGSLLCPHSPPRTPPETAPLASLLEDLDTASLESSVPSTPVPRGRTPGSPKKATGQEDDLYYGLREGPDALPEDSDRLFEPEN